MTLQQGATKEQIYPAICQLEAGNPDSFLILEIESDKIECVQAYRESDGSYHVEILRKGGNATEFGGIRIMTRDNVSLSDTLQIFWGIAEAGDTSSIPKLYAGFKDNTARLIHEREDAQDFIPGKKTTMDKAASRGEIIKALCNLVPGDPDSFLTVEIGGDVIDCIQAKREKDGLYHVEILEKGGDPEVFNGEKILSMDDVKQETAIKIFLTVIKKKDISDIPGGKFRDTTKAAARAQRQQGRQGI